MTLALLLLHLFSNANAIPRPAATVVRLSLKEAIDTAVLKNVDFQLAQMQLEQSQITYRNAWRTFYLPNLSLTSTTYSDSTIGSFPGTPAGNSLPGSKNSGFPQSTVGLTLGSYTLFNFFRDRITYDNARIDVQRANERILETKRFLRFSVMNAYFFSRFNQEKMEAAERSKTIAQTILKLIKSRIAIGTATQNEYDSAQVDFNDASLTYASLKADYETSNFTLNALLNQDTETPLDLTTPLEYKAVSLDFPKLFAWFKDHNPNIRDARASYQRNQGLLEIAEKNRMPLPTVTFSGVTVSYGNRYTGGSSDFGGVHSGHGGQPAGQIDVEAAVNLTVPIFGPGGLFGDDTVKSARIEVNKSETQLTQLNISGDLQVRSAITQLKQVQDRFPTLQKSFDSSAQLLDRVVSEMASKKHSRLELRDAIDRARNSEIDLLQNTYNFINQRNALFVLIGLDGDELL